MDQDVDRVALDLLSPAVDLLLDLSAREDVSRALHEDTHQREFSCRQHPLHISILKLQGREIQSDIAADQKRLCLSVLTPENRPHSRQQFLEFEGFDQVIVCAEIKAPDAVLQAIPRRNNEDRHGGMGSPGIPNEIKSGPSRKSEVQQHERVIT